MRDTEIVRNLHQSEGWRRDVAGFRGPLTWEEEERRRDYYKRIDWKE